LWHHQPVRFTTALLVAGKTATGFRVPPDVLVSVAGARTDETRRRRIERAIAKPHEGRPR
jgi:hypothetical protein